MAISNYKDKQPYENLFCFIHIPKTGGSSISQVLGSNKRKYIDTHCHARTFRDFVGQDEFDKMFKFAFIRNPWARLVSLWKFRMRKEGTPNKTFEEWYWEVFERITIETTQTPNDEEIVSNLRKPQLRWLIDENDIPLIDFVGEFEKLDKHWNEISKKINIKKSLPHTQKSQYEKPWQEYIPDDIKKQIENDFYYDIELGGYSFDD